MKQDELNNRIKKIRVDNKKTQAQFAKELNITQGNLSLIESGKTILNLDTLKKIKTKYGLSYSWIIEGVANYSDNHNLIPLIDQSAMAGYPANHSNEEYMSTLASYRIPGFDDGDYKIFEVEGESMLPTLLPHDFIICVRIEAMEKIVDGSLAIIVLDDGVLVKRMYKMSKNEFRFESDNINYKSIIVKRKDILEMYGVQAKITQSLHSATTTSNKKIVELEEKMERLTEEMSNFKNKFTK